MELKEAISKRHSTRSFSTKKVKLADALYVLDSAIHAPSAGGVNTIKLILVDNAETIKELAKVSFKNEFLAEAPYLIVVCSDLKQKKNLYGTKGAYYAAQEAGAAIQNMLLRIEDLGLASCWVGSYDENVVKRILEIKENYRVEAMLPLGYEFKRENKFKRTSLRGFAFYNKFGKKTQ